MLERVVAAVHVVAQKATSYRTGVTVIGRIKKSFRISLLLGQNHRNVVVEAQRRNIEEHSQFRYLEWA